LSSDRPKIAALVTEYRKFSHGQHIVDRFLEGYGWNGRHHRPPMDVVSLYVDLHPEGDLTPDRLQRFPSVQGVPTIADALTLGGSDLAVDGVLLVGEHGNYGRNEKNQQLYPRYEFFQQIVSVYRTTGKSAPVFNDKHLSYRWDWARQMYDQSVELDFAFMAGSSLPVTWRTPSLDMPLGADVEEAVCVCYGGVDSYDFHGLETLQCMVERRAGGEHGVVWIETYRGDRFWEAHHEGVWSRDLFEAALSRSHTISQPRPGFNDVLPNIDELKKLCEKPVAYVYEHADGLRSTMLLMSGLVQDFNVAARLAGQSQPLSTQMYLPMPPARTTLANFFSPQVNNVEQMFLTGKATYPVERTLMTTGLTAAAVETMYLADRRPEPAEQNRIDTPHLAEVRYQPNPESTFWRT
jgi:hypothetical protein